MVLEISYQSDHFIKRNFRQFNTDIIINSSLNSFVQSVLTESFELKMNSSFLHDKVFENMAFFMILGSINSFQVDLFKNF
jgi:hypothetical protein